MQLKVIAYARNGHTDKFGIPRQSREESPILTRIVFEPEYNVREALRGIEGYSHLWLIWGFSEITRSREHETTTVDINDWSPTVRPPRLGGNKRMGVFATRSPFRPNPIGLSSVKLLKVEYDGISEYRDTGTPMPETSKRISLLVSGADVLDGTPIYDIKPYLSFSDSHPDAKNGFADDTKDRCLPVRWDLISRQRLDIGSTSARHRPESSPISEKWQKDVHFILSQDPRPGYQNDPEREYKLDYDGWRVTFVVSDDTIIVQKVEKITKKE